MDEVTHESRVARFHSGVKDFDSMDMAGWVENMLAMVEGMNSDTDVRCTAGMIRNIGKILHLLLIGMENPSATIHDIIRLQDQLDNKADK